MAQERFDIYFAGELLPDHAPEAVRQWLSAQFKLQGEALDRLFSGQAMRIKQGVDMDTAGRYRAAFRKAGALVEIRPVVAAAARPPAATPPSSPTEPASDAKLPELLPARTGSLEDYAPAVEAREIPDISHMALGGTDAPLDAHQAPPDAAIDVSHLALDTAAQPLDDSPDAPAADIDISHLSALPAHSGDLSDCVEEKSAQPLPDISQLHLADK